MATSATYSRSSASGSGPSLPCSHTPTCPGRESKFARSRCHSASGTITSPCGGMAGSTPSGDGSSSRQSSCANRPFLMIVAIYRFLERLYSDAPHRVDETLVLAVAPREISPDESVDYIRHLFLRDRRPDHFADRRVVALISPYRDLVEL